MRTLDPVKAEKMLTVAGGIAEVFDCYGVKGTWQQARSEVAIDSS